MENLLDRLSTGLSADLRALSLTGPRARGALRTSLAVVLATLVALALHLDNPWWAAITGVVLIQGDRTATLARSIDRVIGTTIGAVIGYLAAATIADHLLFLAVSAGCTGFVIYAQERAEHSYAFLLGGITIVLILFGSLAEPGAALHLAIYRALEIYVGVIVACAVDFALAEAAAAASAAPKPGIWTRPIDRELASIAVTGGIAIALIPLIWETLQLPGLGQTPITAFVILTAMRQEPVWRALTRAAGCFLGGVYGLTAMHLVGDAFVPWVVTLFAGLYLFAHITHGKSDASYVGLQAGIAIVVAMIQGQGPSADLAPALNRLVGVFGGVLVVSICQPLLAPLVRRVIDPRQQA
jgi:uncharacterized membrane protein YccC